MSQDQKPAFVAYNPELAYWPAQGETPRAKAVKEAALLLAKEIIDQTPAGPNQTLALRHVEDATFRALYAIDQEEAAKEWKKTAKKAA